VPARDPEDRATVALIAALERWGREPDRTAATQPARDAHRAKFAREVDPDGVLDPAEREKRVDHLVRAHMLKMSRAAKKTRAAKATTTGGGPDAA
jgi:hypothetical protein